MYLNINKNQFVVSKFSTTIFCNNFLWYNLLKFYLFMFKKLWFIIINDIKIKKKI